MAPQSPSPAPTPRRLQWVDFAMIGVALIWGVNSPVIKASVSGLDPTAFNALRFLVASLLLFTYLVLTEPNWRLDRADRWRVLLLGLVGNGLYQWFYMEGIARTSASNTGLILGMSPLLVTVWAAVAGTDRLSPWVVGGSLLSVAGVLLVFLNPAKGGLSTAAWTGDALVGLAATCWGAYTVYSRPVIQRVGSALKVTAWGMLFGSIPLALLGAPWWARHGLGAVRGEAWMGLLFSALLALGVGYLVYNRAVQAAGGARTAIYINLVPIISAAVAAVTLHEVWTPLQWAGATLVVVGLTVAKLELLRPVVRA